MSSGNLSVRTLADVVHKEDFVLDSEYLETVLVAVPKYVRHTRATLQLLTYYDRTLTKSWNQQYERLTSMIVPRSSKALASDDEYTLFGVVIFRRIHDEFVQKCRENKCVASSRASFSITDVPRFIVRDFVYSDEEIERARQELDTADMTEKELWVSSTKTGRR